MLGLLAAFLKHDWNEGGKHFRLAMAGGDSVAPDVRFHYAVGFLVPTGRPSEAAEQMGLAIQQDPLNSLWRFNRANCLAADGRDQEDADELRAALNPNMALAQLGVAAYHVPRGSWTKPWRSWKKRTA
jgi:hypothetical protein